MKEAKVNLKAAGDIKLEQLPASLYINEKTSLKLGFKKDGHYWSFVGKGKGKYTRENIVEEERREEPRRERSREEEVGAASSIPHTFTSHHTYTQQPHIIHHLAIFEAQLLPKISQLFATLMSQAFTEHLTRIHSSLTNLHNRVTNLQTDLHTLATSRPQPTTPPPPELNSPLRHDPSPEPSPQLTPQPEPPSQPSPPPSQPSPKPNSHQPQTTQTHQLSPKHTPEPTPQPPPQTEIPFFDLTDPLNLMTFDLQHFSTEEFLNILLPRTFTTQTQPPTEPQPHIFDTDSEATNLDPTPSPSLPPQLHPEPTLSLPP
ncbi:hypothetical protein ACLOJK_022880 [Asimina triloba]